MAGSYTDRISRCSAGPGSDARSSRPSRRPARSRPTTPRPRGRHGAHDRDGEPRSDARDRRRPPADGVTPAAGVILYAYHTDAAGLYGRTPNADPRIQGWVRTDKAGRFSSSRSARRRIRAGRPQRTFTSSSGARACHRRSDRPSSRTTARPGIRATGFRKARPIRFRQEPREGPDGVLQFTLDIRLKSAGDHFSDDILRPEGLRRETLTGPGGDFPVFDAAIDRNQGQTRPLQGRGGLPGRPARGRKRPARERRQRRVAFVVRARADQLVRRLPDAWQRARPRTLPGKPACVRIPLGRACAERPRPPGDARRPRRQRLPRPHRLRRRLAVGDRRAASSPAASSAACSTDAPETDRFDAEDRAGLEAFVARARAAGGLGAL
jgi:hypothetical protein